MDKEGKSSGGPPGGGFVVIALLTAGVIFVANKPLESSRPAQPEQRVELRKAAQDTDARLWQDPFAAVAKARERATRPPGSAATDAKVHNEARFAGELLRQAQAGGAGGVVVLAVMLSGGPYAERVESRLRTRHAVLAGLNARGFVPGDSEHIGYFYPDDNDNAALPETLPFESFEPAGDVTDRAGDCQHCRVVVLWLDSTSFYEQPLQRLAGLAQRLGQPVSAAGLPMRWRVLGPSSSDGLRAIVEEAATKTFDAKPLKALDFRFVSGAATVPDAMLLRGVSGAERGSVSDFLASRGVALLRSIGSDDQLAGALVQELALRGLRSRPLGTTENNCADAEGAQAADLRPSSIAIVSEWDTLYGRTLRRQFRYDKASARGGFCVTRWHYVRGLDGRLPGDTAPPSESRSKKDSPADAGDTLGRNGTYVERPEGQNQFDYLRRLATRMREEDAAMRRRNGPEGGIRAVGVLGNDVYDKLLVLQALQDELPHAIFFTTDLDARMFHPTEQAWARNLIVASNFGLRLDDRLQREFAPFRDSYQTSAYLSTLIAMADAGRTIDHGPDAMRLTQAQLNAWFDHPRLFEISRSGVFDYSAVDVTPGATCRRSAVETCQHIHPPGSPMTPHASPSAVFLVAGVLMLALWAPALALSRDGKRRLRRFVAQGGASRMQRGLRAAAVGAVGVALAVLPPLLLAGAWPDIAQSITRDGKPLSFSDGISPWPTYAIRTATLVLCIYLVWRSWAALAGNINDIARDLRLGATRRHLTEALAAEAARHNRLEGATTMLSLRFYRERPGLLGPRNGMTAAAVAFWKHFLVQNRASARLLRTLLCIVLMSGLTLLITNAMGEAPASPQRGTWSAWMQTLSIWPTGLAIQFLIFFVADATLLSVFFVRGLRMHSANWPQRTLLAFQAQTGVPAEHLDDWIDLQFIARRTVVIGRLIYYPFIALSLMLAARSSFFDDWNSPPSVYVIATLCYAIVLGCALALRWTAEASRKQAVERLRNGILRAKGTGNTALASQLEILRERAEKLDDGAFAPYSKQPLLRAVLLPLLTFGGSSLFDYLTLLNL